jgi:hypothetical protein
MSEYIIGYVLLTGLCFGQATLGQVPVQPSSPDSAIPSKVLAAESWFNTPGMDNSMSFLTMRAMGGYLYLHVSSRRALSADAHSAILKIDTFGNLIQRLDMPTPTQGFEVDPAGQVLGRYFDHSGFTTTIQDSAGSVRHTFQVGPETLAVGFHGGKPVALVNSRVIPFDSTVVGHEIPVPPPPPVYDMGPSGGRWRSPLRGKHSLSPKGGAPRRAIRRYRETVKAVPLHDTPSRGSCP